MLHFTRWKQIAIVLTCLAGPRLHGLPNFFAKETLRSLAAMGAAQAQLNLGLDLRGGAHLLLAMETAEVRKDWLDTLRDDARKRLRDAKIGFSAARHRRQCRAGAPRQARGHRRRLRRCSGLVAADSATSFSAPPAPTSTCSKGEGGVITITPTEAGLQHRISNAIGAAIETVRRRVDAMGTTEPNIVRQGSDRILVQVPGLAGYRPSSRS